MLASKYMFRGESDNPIVPQLHQGVYGTIGVFSVDPVLHLSEYNSNKLT